MATGMSAAARTCKVGTIYRCTGCGQAVLCLCRNYREPQAATGDDAPDSVHAAVCLMLDTTYLLAGQVGDRSAQQSMPSVLTSFLTAASSHYRRAGLPGTALEVAAGQPA